MQFLIDIQIALKKFKALFSQLISGVLRRIRRRNKPESVLEVHNRLFKIAAKNLGYKVTKLNDRLIEIVGDDARCFSSHTNFSFESLTAYWICGDKFLSSRLMKRELLPVPPHRLISAKNFRQACEISESFSGPVVVKPARGAHGEGVTVKIESRSEFRRAFIRAAQYCDDILVEKYVSGNHWRVTILAGELIVAWQRIPAQVTGDGVRTIGQLVRRENESIPILDGFALSLPLIINDDAKNMLAEQGHSLDTVLNEGQVAKLQRICNATLGGRTVDVTSSIHPDILDMAVRAANSTGAKLAGIDFIADDICVKPITGQVYINEINTTPGMFARNFDVADRISVITCAEKILKLALTRHGLSAER